ncbi:hypothetical protein DPMN_174516 [Dreissena polymorpha]|uniref:Uncharacterized protein n=1 Tax=Dreissena polymorpha TaxID=45954 RepID=A0A9D4E4S1_DREPO|nr:hypothetical protein DPMN_174516 [Dreissena polymorpha]
MKMADKMSAPMYECDLCFKPDRDMFSFTFSKHVDCDIVRNVVSINFPAGNSIKRCCRCCWRKLHQFASFRRTVTRRHEVTVTGNQKRIKTPDKSSTVTPKSKRMKSLSAMRLSALPHDQKQIGKTPQKRPTVVEGLMNSLEKMKPSPQRRTAVIERLMSSIEKLKLELCNWKPKKCLALEFIGYFIDEQS